MARFSGATCYAPYVTAMNEALFAWFDTHRRDLAFREARDPYAVLVSEVMLQQTQVGRVGPAWAGFMARFPTVAELAAASPADVIRAWAGLGYYGRAIRLRRAAQAIVERHGGQVPDDPATLETLPGIGRYTSRAVAAIAFGRSVAAVDTNVGRVVRRVCGRDGVSADGLRVADSTAVIQRLADGMVAAARPAEWTHAVMDVGASLCRRHDPRCAECPLRPFCRSAEVWMASGAGPAAASNTRRPDRPRRTTVAFPATRRWLRGRILARLRDEADGRWISFRDPIGDHALVAVEDALRQLAAEGLIERNARGRARLPQGPSSV